MRNRKMISRCGPLPDLSCTTFDIFPALMMPCGSSFFISSYRHLFSLRKQFPAAYTDQFIAPAEYDIALQRLTQPLAKNSSQVAHIYRKVMRPVIECLWDVDDSTILGLSTFEAL